MRAFRPFGTILTLACALSLCGCQAPRATAPSALAAPAGRGALGDEEPVPPAPDPPAPNVVTINVVGTSGYQSFNPNPATAAVGDTIVWTNNDRLLHHIVLDDGTDVGDVAPGASTVAVPLTTATATYHCTIHPSMVGGINQEMTPPEPEPPQDPYSYPPFYYARPSRR